jgi:hypothetical protein
MKMRAPWRSETSPSQSGSTVANAMNPGRLLFVEFGTSVVAVPNTAVRS